MTSKYAETYAAWQTNPERFWAEAAQAIDWFTPWVKVLRVTKVSMVAGSRVQSATPVTTPSTAMSPTGVVNRLR